MLLPALVFCIVLLLVLGSYWAFVRRPEQTREATVRRRLARPKAVTRLAPVALVKDYERLSNVPALNSLLARRGAIAAPLQRLIQQADVKTTVGVIVLSTCLLFLTGFVVGDWATGYVFVGLLLGAPLAAIPVSFLSFKRQRRTLKFEELFPEAIDLLSRALRAGHAFTTALGMVAEEMPQPIAGEFRLLYDRQNFGLPLPEAMREFAERVPLLDARFFVIAVLTQRESGGNLSEILDNLASVIRDRFKVRREVRTKSAHGRMTGWVLVAMPPALALILLMISPEYLRPLVEEPAGVRMVITGIGLQILGTVIIRRIVRIDF